MWERGYFCKQINNYEWLGDYFIVIYVYVDNSPYLFVCGDDRVIYYPGPDDVSGELGDA